MEDFISEVKVLETNDFDCKKGDLPKITKEKLSSFVEDIFGYDHCPSDELTDIDSYYKEFGKKYIKMAKTIIAPDIRKVYCYITYPLDNPALIKFVCNKPVTYGMLLYCYTYAYQLVYDLEDKDVRSKTETVKPNMLNSDESGGRFGIWGHSIGELGYNGGCKIKIYKTKVICSFSCDS